MGLKLLENAVGFGCMMSKGSSTIHEKDGWETCGCRHGGREAGWTRNTVRASVRKDFACISKSARRLILLWSLDFRIKDDQVLKWIK